jgi:GxxExxY protein
MSLLFAASLLMPVQAKPYGRLPLYIKNRFAAPITPPPRVFVEPHSRHFVQRFQVPESECQEVALPPPEPSRPYGGPTTEIPADLTPRSLKWETVIGLACDVYSIHGPGHSEKTYQKAVFYALYNLDIACTLERVLYSVTDGLPLHLGRVDLEICRRFVIEFKISPPTATNLRKDVAQLRRYLRGYRAQSVPIERGALVYFFCNSVRVVEVEIAPQGERYAPY